MFALLRVLHFSAAGKTCIDRRCILALLVKL
jgi:hypothetical protein